MKYFNNKPIEDSTEPLNIKVMRRDINSAVPRDPTCCAIAQRLKRIKGVSEVRVGAEVVLVEKKDKAYRYLLAPEDKKRVRDFDAANYFRPDVYHLIPPPPRKRLGARNGTQQGSNTRTGKARTVYNSPPLRHALRPPS